MRDHARDWSEQGVLRPHSPRGCASRSLQSPNYCGREKEGTAGSLFQIRIILPQNSLWFHSFLYDKLSLHLYLKSQLTDARQQVLGTGNFTCVKNDEQRPSSFLIFYCLPLIVCYPHFQDRCPLPYPLLSAPPPPPSLTQLSNQTKEPWNKLDIPTCYQGPSVGHQHCTRLIQ